LFAALYSQLQRLARRELTRKGGPVSLSTITLLHEAYLEIAGNNKPSFADRGRFMSYAARVMRGLIIDHARSRQAQKRGGQFEITANGSRFRGSSNASVPAVNGHRAGRFHPGDYFTVSSSGDMVEATCSHVGPLA
ncbi:MAG: ECF-type sigma factor, partial [Candidatus Acidiferrales bacterium]